jgi:FkbM family methyltransferase
MNYNYAFPHIDKDDVKLIFELGARDCKDSLALHNRFKCPVYAFECNPEALTLCHETLITGHTSDIHLIEKAVNIYDGNTSFYQFDLTKHDNIGASSLFHHINPEVQKEVVVPCCRLDTFIQERNIRAPDLLCMDIQGAELRALQGLGPAVRDIQYVATECSVEGIYTGSYVFKDLYYFMEEHGFEHIWSGYSRPEIISFLNGDTYGIKEMDVIFERA